MALYDLAGTSLSRIEPTTFTAAKVLERSHLQAALRENIELIDVDLLVVAEEFGEFADANRRVDLLCIDRSARLVVVELKRTNDGGHMDLQAIRYAAMVSTMTFDELASHYGRFRKLDLEAARSELIDWLDDTDTDEPVVQRDVGIVLVSQDFDVQITTTALWLNDVQGMDVRCIRITPYMLDNRLVLDVQQVIPLPEAEQFTVKLRRREAAVKAAKATSRDFTKFVVTTADGSTAPLNKRNAALATVKAAAEAGASMAAIAKVLGSRLIVRDGLHAAAEVPDALRSTNPTIDLTRFFIDQPLHADGQTWIVSKMWGRSTADILQEVAALTPRLEPLHRASGLSSHAWHGQRRANAASLRCVESSGFAGLRSTERLATPSGATREGTHVPIMYQHHGKPRSPAVTHG